MHLLKNLLINKISFIIFIYPLISIHDRMISIDIRLIVPRSQNKDNFLDKAFTKMAEGIVKVMPIASKEKEAYLY